MPLKAPPEEVAKAYAAIQPLPSDPQQRNKTLQEFLGKVGRLLAILLACLLPGGLMRPCGCHLAPSRQFQISAVGSASMGPAIPTC